MKMKFARHLLALLALTVINPVAAIAQSVATRADQIRSALLDSGKLHVLIAAHRGDWRNAPENSIDAIEKAIAMGVDIVEIDLARTRDGELVLMHDRTVDRTTTGKGKVSDLTLAQIKALRLRNGAGHATAHQVPTLREAMLTAKGRVIINLDKSYEYWAEARPILKETGTLHQIIIKGSVSADKARQEIGPDIDRAIFMPVLDLRDPAAVAMLATYRDNSVAKLCELVFDDDARYTPEVRKQLVGAGMRIWINTLWPELCGGHDDDRAEGDKENTYAWLVSRNATVLQTDRPAAMIAWLHSRGLRE